MLRDRLRQFAPYIGIAAACAAVFIPFFRNPHPIQIGDGSEYYALAVAWGTTGKPFMTDASRSQYQRFVDSGAVEGVWSASDLARVYGQPLGDTYDLRHFWMYSLLAAAIGFVVSMLGFALPLHAAFLALHCLLLMMLGMVAWHCYRWRGTLAAGMLVFLSPVLWYADKVHVEWFTVCFATSAVVLFVSKRYLWAAFGLAMASTQNISFAAIATVPLAIGIGNAWKTQWRVGDVVLGALTVCLMVVSPLYSFFRWGGWNLLLASGGNLPGVHPQYLSTFILDPDVGLLPNWPFGLLIAVLAIIALRTRDNGRGPGLQLAVFGGCYILMSALAQSSAITLNNGGTPGISRYAVWYIPLWFPLAWYLMTKARASLWSVVAVVACTVLGGFYGIRHYWPSIPETYTTPTIVSRWIQTYLPSLYNPPPEIFAERYSGKGDEFGMHYFAVVGPDCRKLLIVDAGEDGSRDVVGGKGCGLALEELPRIVLPDIPLHRAERSDTPLYMSLSDAEVRAAQFAPIPEEWYSFASGHDATSLLLGGWGTPEDWGTWSTARHASLKIPCPPTAEATARSTALEFDLAPYMAPGHASLDIVVAEGSARLWAGTLDYRRILHVELPAGSCLSEPSLLLDFEIRNPISPFALGLSGDQRELGIALVKMRFVQEPE